MGILNLLRRQEIADCGHKTLREGHIEAYGEETRTKMPRNKDGKFDYCLKCIEAMAIQCAWCGGVIFIGGPVTLYCPGPRHGFFSSEEDTTAQLNRESLDYTPPEGAVLFQEEPPVYVGCLRMTCADTGADWAGTWLPGPDGKGHVKRQETPLEVAARTGQVTNANIN